MKKKASISAALAFAALLIFAALPATAEVANDAPATEVAAAELPLLLPEAEAAMGQGNNMCKGQFTEIYNYFFFVLSQSECDTQCTDWCDGEGGTLVSALFSPRGLDCRCTCCVPK